MNKKLTVLEKFSKRWPQIAVLSLLMTIAFFLAYLMVSDILLEGYLRLAAFGFFALAVLSLFKLKEGQIRIVIEVNDEQVITVAYQIRNQLIKEEKWSVSEFESLRVDEMPNRSLYNDIMKSDRCVRFRRKNESDWMYLNKVNGKVVPLSEENAVLIYNFFRNIVKK